MEIHEVVSDLNTVPEDLRENYEEVEGQGFVLKMVKGLKTALDKERTSAKEKADALKAAEGDTATKIQAAVTAREAELKAESSQTESDELKKARDEASKAKRDASAVLALQRAGGNITLLQDKVTSRLAVDEKGNTYVADEDGTPLLNDEGSAMTVDELVAGMRTEDVYAGAFKGAGGSGFGVPPDGGGGSAPPANGGDKTLPGRRSLMTPRQKVDFIRERGDPAYQDLPY